MFCTFVALLLMETGQPALIYLIPFTLIPVCLWGFFEGTLGKINAPVVSFCARQLGLKEFTESRDDGHPCNIYWHSIVFPDMNSVVKSGARVNKFPGKFFFNVKNIF
uniref:Uncharacterized protein n=1 Tax=Meloidogyne enterolobii TaxID=390850 RepID=A0A6V7VK73_MELEN|nr:unnamed protein product [Meloidogyne enterolobii]